MEDKLKNKVKSFLTITFYVVNRLPDEVERKRIILDLADKLTPMKIVHKIGDAGISDDADFDSDDGIIVDHTVLQFKLEESFKHAFGVIDRISDSERRKLLNGIREVVWDFHNLVKTIGLSFTTTVCSAWLMRLLAVFSGSGGYSLSISRLRSSLNAKLTFGAPSFLVSHRLAKGKPLNVSISFNTVLVIWFRTGLFATSENTPGFPDS